MRRKTLKTEQTLNDETVVRIEAGRSLYGLYWSHSTGQIREFSMTLEGAIHGVAATAGLIIAATSATLMAL